MGAWVTCGGCSASHTQQIEMMLEESSCVRCDRKTFILFMVPCSA